MPTATVVLLSAIVAGCVNPAVVKDTIVKLEESHHRTIQVAKQFEAFREQATQEIQALKQEQARLARELITAHVVASDTQTDLESSKYHLDSERQLRHHTEEKLKQLEMDRRLLEARIEHLDTQLEKTQKELGRAWEARGHALARVEFVEQERVKLTHQLDTAQSRERRLERLVKEARRERDGLLMKAEDLQKSLSMVQLRLARLDREKKRARAALTKARNRAKMLEATLSAEQENWRSLQKALTKVRQNAEPAVP